MGKEIDWSDHTDVDQVVCPHCGNEPEMTDEVMEAVRA